MKIACLPFGSLVRDFLLTSTRQRRRARNRGWSSVPAECLEHRQLLSAAPSRPVISEPGAEPTELNWNDDQTAAAWELWVDNNTTNTNAAIHETQLTQNSFGLRDSAPGVYRAWVRGSNAHGAGPWSVPVVYVIGEHTEVPGKPEITMNGTFTSAEPLTLTWSEPARSQYHQVWVNRLDNQTGRVLHETNLRDNTHVASSPLPAGDYRVWARSKNTAGNGVWSEAFDFVVTTDSTRPGKPVIQPPVATPTGVSWSEADRADTYEIWADNLTTGETGQVRRDQLTRTSLFALGVWDPGTFRVWVRASNAAGHGPWSDPVDHLFSAFTEVPARPEVQAPDDSLRHDDPVQFHWSAAQRADYYEVWLDDVTAGSAKILHVQNLTTNQYLTESAVGAGDFQVWVRAKNGVGSGQWSAPVAFTIRERAGEPGQPVLHPPSENPYYISWKSVAGADTYEIRADNLTTGEVDAIREDDLTSTSYRAAGRWRPGRYRIWVRAANEGGNSPWSEPVETVLGTQRQPPQPPTELSVRQRDTAGRVEISWTDADLPDVADDAEYFEVWVGDLSSGRGRVLHVVNLAGRHYYYSPEPLTVGEYRLWMRASNERGASGWSRPYDFVVTDNVPGVPVILAHSLRDERDLLIDVQSTPGPDRYELLFETSTLWNREQSGSRTIVPVCCRLPADHLDAVESQGRRCGSESGCGQLTFSAAVILPNPSSSKVGTSTSEDVAGEESLQEPVDGRRATSLPLVTPVQCRPFRLTTRPRQSLLWFVDVVAKRSPGSHTGQDAGAFCGWLQTCRRRLPLSR